MMRIALLLAVTLSGLATSAATGDAPEARVTLDVRDADIHAVVSALVEVPGFQVVFDPGISCKLTVAVREASWARVLQATLSACGLGHEEEGTVVRIATRDALTKEAAEQRRLAEEAGRTRSHRIALFRLSYARAREMAPLLKKYFTERGEVTYDERTNTLIIVD